jgi:hypothetical protein
MGSDAVTAYAICIFIGEAFPSQEEAFPRKREGNPRKRGTKSKEKGMKSKPFSFRESSLFKGLRPTFHPKPENSPAFLLPPPAGLVRTLYGRKR